MSNLEAIEKMMTKAQNVNALLSGIRILVTRPVHQAQAFCAMLEQLGGEPVCLPVIDIVATQHKPKIKTIKSLSFAIFISPNAVEYGLAVLLAQGKIPDKLKLVTIGQASADKVCEIIGRMPDIYPRDQYNSETLLALKALSADQVREQSIIIFRGEGGKELLANTLRERGANVDYAEVYRRQQPHPEKHLLCDIFTCGNEKAKQKPDIICLTSNEGLNNLVAMLDELPDKQSRLASRSLWQIPLLVVTEHMRNNARQMGFKNTITVATKASNNAMLESILEWARLNHKNNSI